MRCACRARRAPMRAHGTRATRSLTAVALGLVRARHNETFRSRSALEAIEDPYGNGDLHRLSPCVRRTAAWPRALNSRTSDVCSTHAYRPLRIARRFGAIHASAYRARSRSSTASSACSWKAKRAIRWSGLHELMDSFIRCMSVGEEREVEDGRRMHRKRGNKCGVAVARTGRMLAPHDPSRAHAPQYEPLVDALRVRLLELSRALAPSAIAFTHELIAWRIGRLRIAWITISCFPASVNASVANDWTAFVRSPTDCAAVSTPPTIESFRFGLSCSAIMSVTEPLR